MLIQLKCGSRVLARCPEQPETARLLVLCGHSGADVSFIRRGFSAYAVRKGLFHVLRAFGRMKTECVLLSECTRISGTTGEGVTRSDKLDEEISLRCSGGLTGKRRAHMRL